MNSLYDRLLAIDKDKSTIIDSHALQVTDRPGESLDVVSNLSKQLGAALSFEKNAFELFAKSSQLPQFRDVLEGKISVYEFREHIMKLKDPNMDRLYKRFAGESYKNTAHLPFLEEKINEVYRFKKQSLEIPHQSL